MSNEAKGPYIVEHKGDNTSTVLDAHRRIVYTTDDESADRICAELNAALTSQAARVKELEEALRKLIASVETHNSKQGGCGCCDYDFGDGFGGSVDDARDALTPKEPQQ